MNTEEFAKTTLISKVEDVPAPVEVNDDYVVSQNKTILRIFAIFAIALALIFWIYAVNSSIVTQTVTATQDDTSVIKTEIEEYKAILDTHIVPGFTFDIKGRNTVLDHKTFLASDFDFEIIKIEGNGETGYEAEISIKPNSSKIFLATKNTVKVTLKQKADVSPNA